MSPPRKHPFSNVLSCASQNSSHTVPPLPFVLCVSELQETLLMSPGSETLPRPHREVKEGSGAQGYDEEGLCDTGWGHKGMTLHHPHAR